LDRVSRCDCLRAVLEKRPSFERRCKGRHGINLSKKNLNRENTRMNPIPATFSLLLSGTVGMTLNGPAVAHDTLSGDPPIVIAHRGASGYRPEHTLEAYALAIAQGAQYIEPDLVMTRDGELLARHEPMLARVDLNPDGSIMVASDGKPVINRTDTSTNAWQLPAYANRLTVKSLDGIRVGGWFVEDFTAAEIRADVRAQERLRDLRTANNAFNDQFVIPTLQEVISLARQKSVELGRTIGVYPETKHPSYFKAHAEMHGLPRMEDRLVQVLHANYDNGATSPVYIQSFEVSNLQYLNTRTQMRLVQLLNASGQPYDFVVSGDERNYADRHAGRTSSCAARRSSGRHSASPVSPGSRSKYCVSMRRPAARPRSC
jgi:glycerophosphoryl diester phosphodiesterase